MTEYHKVKDKSKWGNGPWIGEPDKVQWQDDNTGLNCIAQRNPDMGHWCGYVAVPMGHPLYGKSYHDCNATVHGGPTFSGPGDPNLSWWIGFDCGHAHDLIPLSLKLGFSLKGQVYRDLAYVKSQCGILARQLKALATHN